MRLSSAAQRADLFIAPLRDTYFNRCKSAIKFLEYSHKGIPGVYSRLPMYEAVIQDGQNGFFASDLAEWEAHLEQLIASPALRQEMGQRARQTVTQDWLLSSSPRRVAHGLPASHLPAALPAAQPLRIGAAWC